MDTIKYLELAVSKDEGRYNMQSIYRDTDCMVATDGHRLHLVGNLASIDKPHLLDGSSYEYPNYKVITGEDYREVCSIKLGKLELTSLKALAKFLGKKPIVKLSISDSCLTFESVKFKLWGGIRFDVEQDAAFDSMGIRLDYFIDAIIPDTHMTISQGKPLTNSPIMLSSGIYHSKAFIMPCRITD